MTRRFYAEDRLQMTICQHLRWRPAPGLMWFAVPNGGRRMPIEAQILKATGLRAGVADLILLREGVAYAAEIKTLQGRATASQKQFMVEWELAGGIGEILFGIDEAIGFLERHGLVRTATRQRQSVHLLSA